VLHVFRFGLVVVVAWVELVLPRWSGFLVALRLVVEAVVAVGVTQTSLEALAEHPRWEALVVQGVLEHRAVA
jgi:hypothetical protein